MGQYFYSPTPYIYYIIIHVLIYWPAYYGSHNLRYVPNGENCNILLVDVAIG